MVELIRTNDPVLLSWLLSALAENGIDTDVLDTHASIMEGSISAIPRRLMVRDADLPRARWVLAEAEAIARADRD
ncbi:MAG TPA: DUF2007 domain-containing protein [Rhodospirillales bacterium]|jgi:hypothetical protein|nr:DUF2007 domain-containing protein [Rhodospirillales bacterium]